MGYIKKLKNNELVGGTDKTTIYPVTSTKAVFEEVTEGDKSSFKSQETINKEQQDKLDEHDDRLNTAETEDIKGITINHSETVHTVEEGTNIVNLTIYTAETADDQAIAGLVEQNYNNIIANTNAINAEKNRAESIEGGLQTQVAALDNDKQVKLSVGAGITLTSDGVISATADPSVAKVVEALPTGDDIVDGLIYLVKTSTAGTYSQHVHSTSGWSSNLPNVSLGITADDAIDSTSTNPIQNDAITAQIGYFVCGDSNGSSATKNVDAPSYSPSDVGGAFKIKMNYANTSTGTVYLRFNSDNTTKKELRYNREPVTPDNSWEENEVLSVYYDGTYYQASNAMGGGSAVGKKKLMGAIGYIATNEDTIGNYNSNNAYRYIKYPVNSGDVVKISGKGGNAPRLWAIADTNENIISKAKANLNTTDLVLTMPEGAKWIVINNDYSVYPNYEWYYAKVGSVGAHEMQTEAYLYGDLRTIAVGQTFEENEAVKTTAKQLLRMTKEIQPMSLTDTVEIGDLKVYDDGVNAATYKAQKSVEAYNGTETEGLYAIGSPSIITISVDASSLSIEEDTDISVTIGEDTQTITVPAAESETKAADIAALIASAFTSIDGWTLTDNEDGTLTLKCNTGGSNTISVSSNVGETGLVITSNAVNGTDKLCQYNSGAWGEVAIADYAEDAAEIGVSDGTKMWQKINIDEILYNHTTQDSINSSLENIEVYDYKETLIFDKTIESHPASQTGYALTVPVGFTVGNRYRIVAKMNKGLSKPLTTYLRQDPDESTPNIALSDMQIAASNVTGICFYEPSENSNYQYFNRWADTSTAMSINYKVYLLTPNTVKEEIGKLTEDIKYNQKEITDSISWGTIGIYGEVTINKAGNSGTACSLGGSGTWIHTQSSKHVVIPCTEGDIFDLTVLNNYNYYGWLASYSTPSVDDPVPYIAGEYRHGRNTGSWHAVAPEGTAYLCLCTRDGAGNNTTWTGTAQIKKPLKEILDSAATTDNVEAIVQEEIDERVASYLYYPSSYIPINEASELFSTAYSSQGTALYGDCLASLHGNVSASNNKLRLFNLRTKTVIADNVLFPDFLNTRTHFNTMSFGVVKYDEGDDYPLLYVCSGYTYPEGSSITQVYAVRIVNTGGVYSTQLIQTINLDFGKASDWTEFVIDADNGRAWIKSSGTGFTYICVALPSIDNSEVTINSSTTVIDSFNVKKPKHGLSNTNSQQGMHFYHGRIYQPWGIPDEQGEDSTYITIDNTLTHCRETVVSLKNYGLSDYEAESCFIWENDFYVVMHEGKIFKLIQN